MAACGDSSKAATISKAEFLTKGNAICATLNAHLADVGAGITTEEAAVAYLGDEFVPGLTDTVNQIRALGFPKGDEALLGGLMDDTDAVLADITADPTTFAAATEDPFADINAQLITYGLTVCGQADS